MSEFQYYEFIAVDKPLSDKAQQEVSSWSSRTSASSRRAVFTYSYGSFRHDEEKVILKFFDAFLYNSNWGTKRLIFKLPSELVDFELIKRYGDCEDFGYSMTFSKQTKNILVEFLLDEEEDDDGWVEDESTVLSNILSLRDDLLNRDYRSLFLFWLHNLVKEHESEEVDLAYKIPLDLIPENLEKLDRSYDSFMDFFYIDDSYAKAVAIILKDSPKEKTDYKELVKALSQSKKDNYLLRLLEGETNLKAKLKRELGKKKKKKKQAGTIALSKVKAFVKQIETEKARKTAQKAKADFLKKMKYLDEQVSAISREIETLIEEGGATSYNNAFALLKDLKELAIHQNKLEAFLEHVQAMIVEYTRKPAMVRRMKTL